MPQLLLAQQYGNCAGQSGTVAYSIDYRVQEPLLQSQVKPFALWAKWLLKPAFSDAESRLQDMTNLRTNWDSYGAEPPNRAALESAWRILALLRDENEAPTRVVPSAEGGVAFCFVRGNRYADIECLNEGETLAVTYRGADKPHVWEIENDGEQVLAAIAKIHEHFAV